MVDGSIKLHFWEKLVAGAQTVQEGNPSCITFTRSNAPIVSYGGLFPSGSEAVAPSKAILRSFDLHVYTVQRSMRSMWFFCNVHAFIGRVISRIR